jgi:hypothetical protein
MKRLSKKMKRQIKLAGLLAAVLLVVGSAIYLGIYSHATEEALKCIEEETEFVTVEVEKDDHIAFIPDKAMVGLIFYPGGKVEYEAYAPLMKACAERGILCVLMNMPANLAILDVNAAKGIQEKYEDVSQWYLGGHSLGGNAAAQYISKHVDEYEGLVLLASYASKNISNSGLGVVSVLASNDKVLNQKNYEKNKKNLPSDYQEVMIEGGCHAYFGYYGTQRGDGKATITREEQMEMTVNAILNFVEWDLNGNKPQE